MTHAELQKKRHHDIANGEIEELLSDWDGAVSNLLYGEVGRRYKKRLAALLAATGRDGDLDHQAHGWLTGRALDTLGHGPVCHHGKNLNGKCDGPNCWNNRGTP
jgi:hypothetical protein